MDARRIEEYRTAAVQRAARPADAGPVPGGAQRCVSTGQQRRGVHVDAQRFIPKVRASMVERDGKKFYEVSGYYTMYELGYEMWDWAGPYTEIVSAGAGEATTAANPDVVFLVNHKGLAMARTAAGTIELRSDDTGGWHRSWLNPLRQDVKDFVAAVDDGTVTEQSFAFQIVSGQWSPDYTEYRINAYDIDRGDVSGVNYGANPYTSIAARSAEILDELAALPLGAAREALQRLQRRADLGTIPAAARSADPGPAPVSQPVTVPPTGGMDLDQLDAWLAAQEIRRG